MLRVPPDGKDEASGSLCMRSLPRKEFSGLPFSSAMRKAVCFSAVSSVSGWNQCAQWSAPLLTAQSFIASATVSAMLESSFCRPSIAAMRLSKTSRGSRCFISLWSKTREP